MKRPQSETFWNRSLLAVIFLTMFLRALLLLIVLHTSGVKALYGADSYGYIAPIQHMLHGSFATDAGPELQRTPGYPIFLLLTGMAFNHPLLAVGSQILLAGFSTLLIDKIGLLVFTDAGIAIVAAALYAVEPLSILYGIELLSEWIFTALLLIFLYLLLRYLETPAWSGLILCACTVAATVYVRPASYYLPLCCAVGLALIPHPVKEMPRLVRALVFLLLCSVLIGAWRVRNYVETGYPGFSSIADNNLYFFNAGEVLAQKQHVSFAAELGLLHWQDMPGYLSIHPEQKNWTLPQILAYERRTALQTIAENKVLYLKDHLRGMVVVLFHPCATDYLWILGKSPLSSVSNFGETAAKYGRMAALWKSFWAHPLVFSGTAILEAILIIYYGLALLGAYKLYPPGKAVLTLALFFLYFVVVAGGAAGMARYRYPVLPIVALFAGMGLARILHLSSNSQGQEFTSSKRETAPPLS